MTTSKIRTVSLCLLFILWFKNTYSQDSPTVSSGRHFSIGISTGHYGIDAAFGIDLSTPSIVKDQISFRVKANFTWLENYKVEKNHWASYQTLWAGVVYQRGILMNAKLFYEAGVFYIFPNQKFSTSKVLPGYYSLIGVEYNLSKKTRHKTTYYLSPGLLTSKARAEKLENSPRYGTGFFFNTGFRFYL
jgi:hypothetical protein